MSRKLTNADVSREDVLQFTEDVQLEHVRVGPLVGSPLHSGDGDERDDLKTEAPQTLQEALNTTPAGTHENLQMVLQW